MPDLAAKPRPRPALRRVVASADKDPTRDLERLHAREGRDVGTLVQEMLRKALDETPEDR